MPRYTVNHAMGMKQTPLGVLTTDADGTITDWSPADPDRQGMFDFEITAGETLAHASSRLRLYQFIPRTSRVQEAIDKARANRRPRSSDPDEPQPDRSSKTEEDPGTPTSNALTRPEPTPGREQSRTD